jgi:hypothetical protein
VIVLQNSGGDGVSATTASVAVEARKLGPNPAQIQNRVELAMEMVGGYHIVETELVEKLILSSRLFTHHRSALPRITGKTESR